MLRMGTPLKSTTPTTKVSSLKFRSVVLNDWWLVRSHENGLAVGGFVETSKQGVKGFLSTAISKRCNTTTIETRDGITITLSGFINRSRTCDNGFSNEICNRFLFGFPWSWGSNGGGNDASSSSSSVTAVKQEGGEVLPVTVVRDALMSSVGRPWPCGVTSSDSSLDHILQLLGIKGTHGKKAKWSSTHHMVKTEVVEEVVEYTPPSTIGSAMAARSKSGSGSQKSIVGTRRRAMRCFDPVKTESE